MLDAERTFKKRYGQLGQFSNFCLRQQLFAFKKFCMKKRLFNIFKIKRRHEVDQGYSKKLL